MADKHKPQVLVYDDNPKQAQTIVDLIGDEFDITVADPETLPGKVRADIDVILTDVEIITQGMPEREGPVVMEETLKQLGFAKPVIVYTNVTTNDLMNLKNSSKGELFFGYVSLQPFDWEIIMADLIRKAYASKVKQKGRMFKVWCRECGIMDDKVMPDGTQLLRDMKYPVDENLTYGTLTDWFDGEHDETDAETYSRIIFERLNKQPNFQNKD